MGRASGLATLTATPTISRRRGNAVSPSTAAPPAPAPTPAMTRADLWDLCSQHDMEVATALEDGCFYHVGCRRDLDEIRRDGLLPLNISEREQNFGEYEVDRDCVYLWPSVGNAQMYAHERKERFAGERIVLQAEIPDFYEHLCPDQEDLARHWADHDNDWPEAVLQAAAREAGDAFPPLGSELTFAQSAELIRALSPALRLALANYCALRGDGLMIRRPVVASQLALCELNDIERLRERFDEEYPELAVEYADDEDGSAEDAYYEALDMWMGEQLAGSEIIDAQELEERLQDPGELVDNKEIRYYSRQPLQEIAAA